MSAAPVLTKPPVVLVVEDDERALSQRVRAFETRGCVVVSAMTFEAARAELASMPDLDLILTDINLAGHGNAPDRDGVALARLVREDYDATIPLAASSGAYKDGDFLPDELALFDLLITKGNRSPRQVREFYDSCASLAKVHSASAAALTDDEIRLLHERHPQYRPYATTVRAAISEDDVPIEEAVEDSGYELVIAGPDDDDAVRTAFPVLMRKAPTEVLLRVWGHRNLYSVGRNWNDAILELVGLMSELHEDLTSLRETAVLSPEVEALDTFLTTVLAVGGELDGN